VQEKQAKPCCTPQDKKRLCSYLHRQLQYPVRDAISASRTAGLFPWKYQGVRITVTIQASIKPVEHSFTMWQSMAILTIRNVTMVVTVTIGTLQVGMFFSRTGKSCDGLSVTPRTGRRWSFTAVVNFIWLMYGVATSATTIIDKNGVRFVMTLGTLGDIAVSTVVTTITLLLTMGAWVLLKLCSLIRVTVGTIFCQYGHINQSGNRSMRVAVATEAILEIGTMSLTMTALTLGNSLLPTVAGPIGVKGFVTGPAFLTVQSTTVTDRVKYRLVTAGAFNGCERNNCLRVRIAQIRWL